MHPQWTADAIARSHRPDAVANVRVCTLHAGRSPTRRWRPASGTRISVAVWPIGRDVHVQPIGAVSENALGPVAEACQTPAFSGPEGASGRCWRRAWECRRGARENSTLGVCSDI